MALLAGALADTYNRSILFGCIVIFGESACFATYFTTTYEQLFYCRVSPLTLDSAISSLRRCSPESASAGRLR